MPRAVIDDAITVLFVLWLGLMAIFAVLVFTNNISPLASSGMGLTACALIVGWHLLKRKRKKVREETEPLEPTS